MGSSPHTLLLFPSLPRPVHFFPSSTLLFPTKQFFRANEFLTFPSLPSFLPSFTSAPARGRSIINFLTIWPFVGKGNGGASKLSCCFGCSSLFLLVTIQVSRSFFIVFPCCHLSLFSPIIPSRDGTLRRKGSLPPGGHQKAIFLGNSAGCAVARRS